MRSYTITIEDTTAAQLDAHAADQPPGINVESFLKSHLEVVAASLAVRRDGALERQLEEDFKRLSRQEKVEALEKTKP